jgi:hypothetical protein
MVLRARPPIAVHRRGLLTRADEQGRLAGARVGAGLGWLMAWTCVSVRDAVEIRSRSLVKRKSCRDRRDLWVACASGRLVVVNWETPVVLVGWRRKIVRLARPDAEPGVVWKVRCSVVRSAFAGRFT